MPSSNSLCLGFVCVTILDKQFSVASRVGVDFGPVAPSDGLGSEGGSLRSIRGAKQWWIFFDPDCFRVIGTTDVVLFVVVRN
mmetsp:Transcript_25021/g.36646  ORF Transcript_25021/g.36646 Transcript_25021/m.36646 type:complete len:82 (+) Transcript_25021:1506-1751(+)